VNDSIGLIGEAMPVQKKEKGNILGEQFVVNDLIAYQEGAVVSRTLIDKKVGTVTIFAFDEGQGLSEHTAPFDAMAQILDGQAEIKISGKPFHLKTGEMVVMPSNQPHSLRAITAFKMMLIMIRSEDKVAELVSEKGLKP
jgi:quercetin dioxygenase-like cupin family protein